MSLHQDSPPKAIMAANLAQHRNRKLCETHWWAGTRRKTRSMRTNEQKLREHSLYGLQKSWEQKNVKGEPFNSGLKGQLLQLTPEQTVPLFLH